LIGINITLNNKNHLIALLKTSQLT